MIPGTIPTWQSKSWQDQLIEMLTSPEELLHALELPESLLPDAQKAAKLFPLRVTRAYLSRIRLGDPDDPLLKQVLPLGVELVTEAGFVDDPLEEADYSPAPGIIHKYRGRLLLIAATQCAINCRYCFRRAFPYSEHTLNRTEWTQSLNYIRSTPSIEEVILSGGDPLVLSDKQLHWLTTAIAEIPHVKRLRIHTRLPIVLPDRITSELLRAVCREALDTVVVVHANHPQEIDDHVAQAFQTIRQANITLLNQSVLLKGVNDNADTLHQLSERLLTTGVMPYYLHVVDKVTGATHFAVSDSEAIEIHKTLTKQLSGYLVPKLVREVAGKPAKSSIY